MKRNILFIFAVTLFALSSCEFKAPSPEQFFLTEDQITELTMDGRIYTLHGFIDSFMTEKGNYLSDTIQYRSRATSGDGIYLFSIDTIPSTGAGIYIRGRITTDDLGGNFYKSLCIQQIVEGKQQGFRLSVDMGSVSGMYPIGQEIIIRCNGLAIGRYANQPQLCVPSYNNNAYAQNAGQKIGWAPGRIPAAQFRKITHYIGQADPSLLVYDEISDVKSITDQIDIVANRKMDAKLVRIKNVHYTGSYSNKGTAEPCSTGNPEEDGNANVFAPTTLNVGYPQSRIVQDAGGNNFCVSCSEYAKFAYFYLPGADSTGVDSCKYYIGDIEGILGFYEDNASNISSYGVDWDDWSVTIRDLDDVKLYLDGDKSSPSKLWKRLEYLWVKETSPEK